MVQLIIVVFINKGRSAQHEERNKGFKMAIH